MGLLDSGAVTTFQVSDPQACLTAGGMQGDAVILRFALQLGWRFEMLADDVADFPRVGVLNVSLLDHEPDDPEIFGHFSYFEAVEPSAENREQDAIFFVEIQLAEDRFAQLREMIKLQPLAEMRAGIRGFEYSATGVRSTKKSGALFPIDFYNFSFGEDRRERLEREKLERLDEEDAKEVVVADEPVDYTIPLRELRERQDWLIVIGLAACVMLFLSL